MGAFARVAGWTQLLPRTLRVKDMERRLAAVLAMDMVGYSRLMGRDEAGTLARQRSHFAELFIPKIDAHHGHIVKRTGDGLLAEFPSAVDAVACAAEIQRGMETREAQSDPDRQVVYRIGINLGDIIFEEGDIYGDGVNVAARVEPLAASGGICISGAVFDAVRNKVEVGFEDIGAKSLKNISEPVQVYRVLLDPDAVGKVLQGEGAAKRPMLLRPAFLWGAGAVVLLLAGLAVRGALVTSASEAARELRANALESLKPTEDPRRIAVLFFQPNSPQEEVSLLASGLTETLIDELGRINVLHVMSRNAVAPFRDEVVSPDSIGRALSVGTLVEGTVSMSDEQVRVDVTFVNASTGEPFGSTQVLGTRAGLSQLQDQLAHEVAVNLRERLGDEVELIQRRRTGAENVEAWELVQKATDLTDQSQTLVQRGNADAAWKRLDTADSLLAKAEDVAPEWVEPTVRRGWIAYERSRWGGASEQAEAARWIQEGMNQAQIALHLDSANADALELRGTLRYWKWLLDLEPDPTAARRLFSGAEADLRAAIDNNHGQAGAWAALSHLLLNKGSTAEGKDAALQAYQADAYLRNADVILWRLFSTSYDLDDQPESGRWCDELGRRFPSDARYVECQLWLMTMHDANVDVERAWELARTYERLSPPQTVEFKRRWASMAVAAVLARAGLADSARATAERSRGSASIDPARDLAYLEAFVRTLLGDKDEALDLLAEVKAVVGQGDFDYWWFDGLKGEPRFRTLTQSSGR